jgi:uncharacterized protein (DUF924 family)
MDDVLAFFHEHLPRWWSSGRRLDDEIRRRFASIHAEIMTGEHEDWRATPAGALAYILVLDQFSRNLFRGDARAFASDDRALAAAREAVDRGDDAALPAADRSFVYMPFMHSEQLADQERSLALFGASRDCLRAAERHREIIQRFGRFPHRNAVLGRPSTPDELAFLTEPGSSFG